MAESREKRCVVVVGAGFAGFNAARELSKLVGATSDVGERGQRRVRAARRRESASLNEDPRARCVRLSRLFLPCAPVGHLAGSPAA